MIIEQCKDSELLEKMRKIAQTSVDNGTGDDVKDDLLRIELRLLELANLTSNKK